MRSGFKEIAYDILKEKGKPLHRKEITSLALKKKPLARFLEENWNYIA